MSDKQETQDWLGSADEVCKRLKENLQKRCAAARTFERDQDLLAFWVECLKEALLFRSTELTSTAIDLYQQNKLVSAATITRSLLETTALLNRLIESCAKVVKKHERGKCSDEIIAELLERVHRLSFASTEQRDSATGSKVEPFKVPALIKSLDTQFMSKIRITNIYDELCQILHPNFKGCLDAFTKWDKEKRYMEFIQDYSHMPENTVCYHIYLYHILNIVEALAEGMAELLPKFALACEEYLERQRGEDNEKETC